MSVGHARLHSAIGAALVLVASSLVQAGCDAQDCSETLTCAGAGAPPEAGGADAADAADAAARDATTGGDGPDDDGSRGDAAADGTVDAKGDATNDAANDAPSEATADAPPDVVHDGPADTGAADGPAEGGPPDSSTPCNPTAPDCSNPACQPAFACTPVAPAGWFGPVALYDQGGGPPTPTPPACSGVYSDDSFDGFAGPTSPPVTCTCTCGSLGGGGCSSASVAVYSDGQCSAMCATAGSTTCSVADGPACNTGGGSLKVVVAPAATGTWSCPAGTATTTTSWGWARVGRACTSSRAFTTGGCQNNQVCANAPPASFLGTLCVYKNADLADCSGAPGYPLLHTYYGNAIDGRGCTLGTCGCSAPANPCVLQAAQWFNTDVNASCASGGHAIDVSGSCNTNLGGSQVVSMKASIGASGSCSATGNGVSTGSVTPETTTAVTVCCAQ
jgi:hypothetical protein